MADKTSPIQVLASHLRAAAWQRYLMEPRLDDKRFADNGGTLFHAVDTDVIKLFTNPFHVAVATEKRRFGYAEIFPDDEAPVSIALGRTLAHFIFYCLGGADPPPLFVVPPLEQEVRDVYQAVRRDVEIERKRSIEEFDSLRGLANKLGKIDDEAEIVRLMQEHAPTLAKFFSGTRGAAAEYLRYLRLLQDGRLMPLEAVASDADIVKDEAVRRIFTPVSDLVDLVAQHELRAAWTDRLRKHNRARDTVQLFDDALVLARIESINRKLHDKARLVLITGDQAMHAAGENYFPDGAAVNFARLYLRHPKCYLAEPWVLSLSNEPHGASEAGFIQWLDAFVAIVGPLARMEGTHHPEALKRLSSTSDAELDEVLGKLQTNPATLLDDFRARWHAYARTIMLAHGDVSQEEYEDNQSSIKLYQDITTLRTRVEKQIDQKAWEVWEAFFKAAPGYGYIFARGLNRTRRGMRPRNPPLLDFDRFKYARRLLREIHKSYDPLQLNDYQSTIEKLRGKEDANSDYTYYLVFGALFAAEGLWDVAAMLARRSWDIAQRNDIPEITGREAAYLQAVSLRHAARHSSALEDVSQWLEKARTCLERDKQGYPKLRIGTTRFKAEDVALDLTYMLFSRFQGEAPPRPIRSLQGIMEEARRCLAEVAQQAQDQQTSDDMEERNQKATVLCHVNRHLLTNLFMAALLARGSDPQALDGLEEVLSEFAANISTPEGEGGARSTFLVDAVYRVSAFLLVQDHHKKKSLQRKVLELLNDNDIKLASVMPYDVARFQYLRDLAA